MSYLFLLLSLRSSRQNRCPDFQPIFKKVLAQRGSRRAGSAGRGRPWERIAGAANKGFAARAALALAGLGARRKRPEHSRQALRGLRAISGQSRAKRRLFRCALFCRSRAALLFGTRFLVSKRCFAPARTGCRIGRFGGSCDFTGLAGSAVRVILQDWQDRWNVAQIGDIPETGDPRCRSHMPAPHAPSVPDTCP